jgi:hypothetical protein
VNTFFKEYADLTALALTFVFPVILTWLAKRKAGKKIRAVPSWFLFFGPCGILLFIFFHLLENSYRAISATIAGSFTYNFHFYSLILSGIVVALTGYFFLRACWGKCTDEKNTNRHVLTAMIVAAIVTVPLIPITPIAAVPGICSVLSLLGLPFVRRKSGSIPVVRLEPTIKVPAT